MTSSPYVLSLFQCLERVCSAPAGQVILNYAPSQPLTSEEKDLIWKFRFYLTRDKRGLTKFLKSVTWRDPSEVKQAVEELLPQWTEIDTDDALELLGPSTVDSRVRAYAVKQLSRADDDVSRPPPFKWKAVHIR